MSVHISPEPPVAEICKVAKMPANHQATPNVGIYLASCNIAICATQLAAPSCIAYRASPFQMGNVDEGLSQE